MKRIYIVGIVSVLFIVTAAAQDFRENVNHSLFSDQKANQVGDAITIYIVESLSASNDAKTSSSRESNIGGSGSVSMSSSPSTEGSVSLGTNNSFKGEGSTATQNTLRAKLSARVDSVLPNGNLYIHGSRVILINNEKQTVTISGIVRPSDIQADNSVYSYNISDAVISFQGSGIVSRSQGPGWLTKFFHWLF
ncbi:MAG TPA: flagellar basal body L-ring protein FlgH [Bacteroidota bacterium]|nr:flagellar basal body L-ring protein FlgH [Bacteroidota bacterium]